MTGQGAWATTGAGTVTLGGAAPTVPVSTSVPKPTRAAVSRPSVGVAVGARDRPAAPARPSSTRPRSTMPAAPSRAGTAATDSAVARSTSGSIQSVNRCWTRGSVVGCERRHLDAAGRERAEVGPGARRTGGRPEQALEQPGRPRSRSPRRPARSAPRPGRRRPRCRRCRRRPSPCARAGPAPGACRWRRTAGPSPPRRGRRAGRGRPAVARGRLLGAGSGGRRASTRRAARRSPPSGRASPGRSGDACGAES